MSIRDLWRRSVNIFMFSLTGLATLFTIAVLFFILGDLLWYGATSINWSFLTRPPTPVGEIGGGMGNAIVGSGKILLLAAVVGVPVGLLGGVYLAEFGGGTFSFLVRYTADLLNGVPSIVMGMFAYTVVVRPMHQASAVAGGLALAVMLVPIVLRSTEQFMRAVPMTLREGALALGTSKWRMIATVVIPAGIRGIATGILLSLARVAGETAPLLFTSATNQFWAHGWTEPTASLPVMIYLYASSPYADWHRQAWAAGLVLLGLVLIITTCSRIILSVGFQSARSGA